MISHLAPLKRVSFSHGTKEPLLTFPSFPSVLHQGWFMTEPSRKGSEALNRVKLRIPSGRERIVLKEMTFLSLDSSYVLGEWA
jgi:hypothetical protein